MRREEIERRVAPVVAVGGIELEHRHQLHHRDAELLQVRNLLDHAGVGAACLPAHPRARVPGESADVQLIDHRRALVPGAAQSFLAQAPMVAGNHAERRLPGVRARSRRRQAIERGRKEHRFRVRVEKHLVAIERVPLEAPGRKRAVDPVGVVRRALHRLQGNAAMPDTARLVAEVIEGMHQHRIDDVVAGVQQQGDALRVLRVERKIERLLLFDPGRAQRGRQAFGCRPARAGPDAHVPPLQRYTRTGIFECASTCCVTLPRRRPFNPRCPREAMKMTSHLRLRAASRMPW